MADYKKLCADLRGTLMWCEICSMRHDCKKETASCKTARMSNAADAIEELQALVQNGQSAIDTNKRLIKKIEQLQAENTELTRSYNTMLKDLQFRSEQVGELQTENEQMEIQLNNFSGFLCEMTGNRMSKTNYTLDAMISVANDYQQTLCDDCDRTAENKLLQAENERLKKQLKAAIAERKVENGTD